MNVPESFFKGEIRNSFYVEKLMKKVWAAQLEVLNDVDVLCKKHNIQYFADYGTLLGAVRHKGFIPWDDDMDISMKREDYTKFCEIAQKELAGTYEIVNIHTDPTWNQLLGRIINSREISFDDERLEKFHNCPFAVGLDIFPLDYLAPNKEEDELQCNIIRILQVTINELEKDNLKEEEIISTIQAIENMCSVKFDSNRPYIIQIRELKERICMLYTNEESEYVASMGEHACKTPPELYVYPKEYYSSAIEVPFEYTTIPIPVGYEKILIQKYGENYMVPQIGGSNHDYPFYKDQLQLIYEANGNR
jgi:lipopolysaccharide cholinephosphotransferase